MLPLPQPILGEITAITITSPHLQQSLAYYQQLGFKELYRADWPFPWIQITDGALLIMLRDGKDPYLALTYYVKDINKVVAMLEAKGITFAHKPADTDMIKRYLIQSPDGMNISLVNIIEGFRQPEGPTMLSMPQADYFNPEKYVNKTCGMFGELAHPVRDLDTSIAFWQQLGFATLSRFTSPYPWAILSDGLSVVGLHQATHFNTLAITFFAADMKEKTEQLKAAGISNYDESRGAGNLMLTTPEGQKIFLFKMGM